MWLRFMAWLGAWCMRRLEGWAFQHGSLTLQQIHLENGHGWQASLRAHQKGGGPRYSWTSQGDSIAETIANVVTEAEANIIGAKPVLPHAPRLGGREFDE